MCVCAQACVRGMWPNWSPWPAMARRRGCFLRHVWHKMETGDQNDVDKYF